MSGEGTIVEGLAAYATGYAEMGMAAADAKVQLVELAARFDAAAPRLFRLAAAAIAHQPQPLEESADETERRRPIEEMLGLTSAADQLAAALVAREWLEELAAELEENGT